VREFKTVKVYATKTFEVEMFRDTDTDKYRISYKTPQNTHHYSEWISDFATASFLFDLKINDLKEQ